MASEARRAVVLDPKDTCAVMARNVVASSLLSQDVLWPYSSADMKGRANWKEIQPQRATLAELVTLSEGNQIKQGNLTQGTLMYLKSVNALKSSGCPPKKRKSEASADITHGITRKEAELCTFRLRVMIRHIITAADLGSKLPEEFAGLRYLVDLVPVKPQKTKSK